MPKAPVGGLTGWWVEEIYTRTVCEIHCCLLLSTVPFCWRILRAILSRLAIHRATQPTSLLFAGLATGRMTSCKPCSSGMESKSMTQPSVCCTSLWPQVCSTREAPKYMQHHCMNRIVFLHVKVNSFNSFSINTRHNGGFCRFISHRELI